MADSLFDKISSAAYRARVNPRSKEAQKWFMNNVRNLNVTRNKVLKDPAVKTESTPKVGDMLMYVYDPKLKNELPYYDKFPLSILINVNKDGFDALNLHYLRPDIRAAFLDKLMGFGPDELKENSRLTRLKYDALKGVNKFKPFKACYKRYLTNHVKSQIKRIPMTDWEIAIFLPTEDFAKASMSKVFSDSTKISR
jgi:hypothetical protein|tara:strand:- start:405 stop:992 length:588 start_codon:yes stop_codon:yes gene_type:complete